MREFVTTLDTSRLTHEELNAILDCVSGRTMTSTSCKREFRSLQAALRRQSQMAHELIQRRYEPQPSDHCILRIALEMLNVRFIGGDGDSDVRCQLVRALSEQYDGCDELLSPRPVENMTPLPVGESVRCAGGQLPNVSTLSQLLSSSHLKRSR
ncbi:hypothetical protein Q9L58_010545 [Maublancomyces gigas]|uniref:Uncharacterized protein n=1 Tax=Discina gigas TaxID=1032678 RepID=A0ABR3G3T4_9PEZI